MNKEKDKDNLNLTDISEENNQNPPSYISNFNTSYTLDEDYEEKEVDFIEANESSENENSENSSGEELNFSDEEYSKHKNQIKKRRKNHYKYFMRNFKKMKIKKN